MTMKMKIKNRNNLLEMMKMMMKIILQMIIKIPMVMKVKIIQLKINFPNYKNL